MVKAAPFLLFFLPFFSLAQKATFHLYTTEDGLSRNTVWGLEQDGQGYLWIANDGSLNRFDCQHFLNDGNSDHPVFQKIRKVGNLKADGSYLYFLENHQVVVINTITGEEAAIPFSGLVSGDVKEWQGNMVKLENGAVAALLVNNAAGKTLLAHVRDTTILQVDTLPDGALPHLSRVASDSHGNLFYFSNYSLWKTDAHGKLLLRIDNLLHEMEALIRAGQRNQVFFLKDDKLMVLEEGATEPQPHPVNRHKGWPFIFDVIEAPDGSLWLSGSENHLLFYDASADELYDFKPQVDEIFSNQTDLRALFQDASGTVWVETVMGLLKVVPQRSLFDTYYTGRHDACNGHCSFRGFSEDEKGGIYASYYKNVCKLEEGPQPPKPLARHDVSPYEILFQKGKIFLNDGQVLDPKTGGRSNPYKSVGYPFDIGEFEKDAVGRIWWAWGNDLLYLDEDATGALWKKVDVKQWVNYIETMKYDPLRQWMWFGNREALVAINPATLQLEAQYFNKERDIATIRYIHTDPQGRVWLGTEQGFVRFEPERNFWKTYTMADGLPNEYVHGIQPEGDSCLWLATNNGLSRFSIAQERFINFYEEDGLPDNEFNRSSNFRASDGRLYFGGMRGITAFYPNEVMEKYEHRSIESQLRLHTVSMTDDEMDTVRTSYFFEKSPRLDVYYQNKTVVLEFGLMDFQSEGAIQYSYQLDDHDDTWSNPSTSNSVTFSSLPSGHYVFRVRALNAKGQWAADELAVQLVVHPPFWATWWAYTLYLLAFAGFALAILYVLKRRWELKSQLENEQQEALRLKELDTFKSRLYTNLTHEFRTPLTVILGMAESGKSELGNQEGQDLKNQFPNSLISKFNLIERNGQSLLRLVNQLLDLSKLEDGSFKLDLQRGDIVPFLRYLTNSFQSFAENKQLALHFFSEIENLEMDFDPEQVQQVMTNLLSNAIKFTPSGGEVDVKITSDDLRFTIDSDNRKSSIVIQVKDTGIGIPSEELPHIFDRFYQVDGTTTRAGEGTGIGLAHARELVKLMGGKIEVKSELGKGSAFKVVLPITKNTELKMENGEWRTEHAVPVSSIPEPTGNSQFSILNSPFPSLLIIEDNPDLVFYLKNCLEEHYEITVANNGQVGIEKAIERIPDLILSDVMMPEKDGFEVLETLKNDERTSHIPIALLTAKADVASKVMGLKRGADAYLSKPFHKEELLATLSMMADNRRRLTEHFTKTKTPARQTLATEAAVEVAAGGMETAIKMEDAFLQKLRFILEENYSDENFALPQLCDILCMNRYQLFRKMKAVTDESPSNFIRSFRMEKARQFFETSDSNVSEVAYQVGYKDLAHFSKSFSDSFGLAPSEFRKK
ncbi:MAG: response regulator [Lewinellaceae bacterium]|nr:response regulator [Saprospiraceae bacterium]MCB9337440.1 response regulator [Lewinellaceae bacterium]